MITIQLLGGASLRAGDAPLAGPPAQRHRVALLALAIAAWPQPLARDRAMALLWPEKDLASARRLLNLAVHVLRAALGDGVLRSLGDGLLLDPARVRCDWHELRVAIAAGDHARAARLDSGVLMDGFHLADSTEFAQWLAERRTELAHAHVDALRAVAHEQACAGDVHGRVRTLRRLVAADPYAGAHALALMRALDEAGDRAGALQHAADHVRRLRLELDIDADAQVTAFADRLRRAPARTHAASADDDGGRVSRWLTTEGSIRRAGERVRAVVMLLEPESGRLLWSETWDRELTDDVPVQADMARHIASALRQTLAGGQSAA